MVSNSVLILSTTSVIDIPYLFSYKTGLSLSRMSTNNQISPMQFCCNTGFTLPKQSQRSRSSDKTDLDFWDCFGRKKHRLISEEIRYSPSLVSFGNISSCSLALVVFFFISLLKQLIVVFHCLINCCYFMLLMVMESCLYS